MQCDENTNDKRAQCNCCRAQHLPNGKTPILKKTKGNDESAAVHGTGSGGGECAFRSCGGCGSESATSVGNKCSPPTQRHCSVTSASHSCANASSGVSVNGHGGPVSTDGGDSCRCSSASTSTSTQQRHKAGNRVSSPSRTTSSSPSKRLSPRYGPLLYVKFTSISETLLPGF